MIGLLSAATLLGAIAALTATALTEQPEPRRLARLRAGCGAVAAVLVAASLAGLVSGIWLAVACGALVLSLHAIWLATREPAPLRGYLERLLEDREGAWREQFERPFRQYARRHGRSARR